MDQVLSYVWINRCRQAPGQDENPVPEPYCANAIKIAQQYPEIQVIVWCDGALLNDGSIRRLQARFASVKNIHVRDLRAIPAYACDPIFQRQENSSAESQNIWQRVDYARLLVLHHVLQAGASAAFYSDFDIVDPQLNNDRLCETFRRYGVVFGEAPPEPVENQFMGFGAAQISLLSDWWIPQTRDSIARGDDCSGFAAFLGCLQMYEICMGVKPEDLTVVTAELVL